MSQSDLQDIRHFLVMSDLQGQRLICLNATSYSLGRNPKNSIVIYSQAVSRHHAMLLRVTSPESNLFWFRIIDGGLNGQRSTNGVYVNGQRVLSRDLRHGDLVEFGVQAVKADYFALTNLSNAQCEDLLQAEDPVLAFLDFNRGEHVTVIAEPIASLESSEASILRLASFPELMEMPVVEIEFGGRITYLNPAALNRFPQLRTQGQHHPLLQKLVPFTPASEPSQTWYRTVQVDDRYFEQTIHCLDESELLRIFMTDVTARHQAEQEVSQRDRLMRAMAEATQCLLTEMNHTAALAKVLAILGEATEVDRICIYENHPDPEQGHLAMSLRTEWVRPGIPPLLPQAQSQNRNYTALGLQDCYQTLLHGQMIQGSRSDSSPALQAFLEQDGIQSILGQGLMCGLEFWGHISLQTCQQPRQWSRQECDLLLTLASSLSAALARHHAEADIRYRATHDVLTGLANRALFTEHLSEALQHTRSQQQQLAVMFLDLDRFKDINDRLGHSFGDRLLKAVTHRLQSLIVAPNLLARWGGDEFTILMYPIADESTVLAIGHQILSAFDQPFQLQHHEIHTSASLGIALTQPNNHYRLTGDQLIRQADVALYKAKNLGRNTCSLYQPQDGSGSADLELERDLRYALERGQLEVFYQPQVNLLTQGISGLEALLRWRHPSRGMVSPGLFIPMAEERGWITEIGEWVLREACTQARCWQTANLPSVVMSVNLSLRQFRQPNLVETVHHILRSSGLDPRYLELEITESVAVEDLSFTQHVLKELHDLGVRLSIDDFGTGYSSLNRLQLLPLHTLKIDQSFIRDLAHNAKVSHIVAAIVTLGRSLGLDVIAEGVEQPEQAQFLKSIQCHTAQGFLFHRPMSADAVTAILRETQGHSCLLSPVL